MADNMSFIERDIERYERAKERAIAVGMPEYVQALREAILAMERIKELDDKYIIKGG